jgi:hypothetical protein
MEVQTNQTIFTVTLQEFGTLENLFTDVVIPNSISLDKELKQDETINIDNFEKGIKSVKEQIQEQGLILTNKEIDG